MHQNDTTPTAQGNVGANTGIVDSARATTNATDCGLGCDGGEKAVDPFGDMSELPYVDWEAVDETMCLEQRVQEAESKLDRAEVVISNCGAAIRGYASKKSEAAIAKIPVHAGRMLERFPEIRGSVLRGEGENRVPIKVNSRLVESLVRDNQELLKRAEAAEAKVLSESDIQVLQMNAESIGRHNANQELREKLEAAERERDAEIIKRKSILMELSTVFDADMLCDDPGQQQKYGADFMRGIKHALNKDIIPAIAAFKDDAHKANEEWGEVWWESEQVAKQNIELTKERDQARAELAAVLAVGDNDSIPNDDYCRYCECEIPKVTKFVAGQDRQVGGSECQNPECPAFRGRAILESREGQAG